MLELILPSHKYLDSAREAVEEFKKDTAERIFAVQAMIDAEKHNFDGYFKRLGEAMEGVNLKPGHVPSTTLWLVEDDKCIGVFNIRHTLKTDTGSAGSHIGYEIRPSCRRKGYAKAGLKLALDYAHARLGLADVLITCDEINIGSAKTIQSALIQMGGREVDTAQENGVIIRRFWVRTTNRLTGNVIRVLALAVVKKDGHVLVIQGYDPKNEELFYRLPGGGVDFGETGEAAVKREFMEEMGLELIVEKQLGVTENIFTFSGKPGHEIVLLYAARLSDEAMQENRFPLIEPEFEGKFAEFVSVDTTYPVYPAIDKELLR